MFLGFSGVGFVAMDLISRYANEPDKFNIRSLRLSIVALIIALMLMRSVGVPQAFVFGIISLLIMSPLVYVVRTKWKISGHIYTFTAVTTIMSMVSGWFTLLYLLIPLISWSRLKLRVHTAGQIIAGALIGFAVPVTLAVVMHLVPVAA
jgi:membrane-associated phospholipid phosphatase